VLHCRCTWLPPGRTECCYIFGGASLRSATVQASKKRRLDEVCAERYPEHSRNVVQSWIAQGKVSVNSRVVIKAGAPVAPDAAIVITADVPKFVCRCCSSSVGTPWQGGHEGVSGRGVGAWSFRSAQALHARLCSEEACHLEQVQQA